MARIRHLAIKTPDPERLAAFYQGAFGMEMMLRLPGGSLFLTDGYLTLAILQCRVGNAAPGLHHFGFEVDDVVQSAAKIGSLGVPNPAIRPDSTPYAELRCIDPDGNLFDISEHGYSQVEAPSEHMAKRPKEKDIA